MVIKQPKIKIIQIMPIKYVESNRNKYVSKELIIELG